MQEHNLKDCYEVGRLGHNMLSTEEEYSYFLYLIITI
jgi:hypothetical protein